MTEYKRYRRSQVAEMADWEPGFDMARVSVSAADTEAGSPKPGDKIARNPDNHADKWLVAAAYFAKNFEPMESTSMLTGLLTLLVLLIVLALIAWGARAVLTGLSAPLWLQQVLLVVFLIIAVVLVAQAFDLVPAGLR